MDEEITLHSMDCVPTVSLLAINIHILLTYLQVFTLVMSSTKVCVSSIEKFPKHLPMYFLKRPTYLKIQVCLPDGVIQHPKTQG